ncbi:glycosyltransferase family 87 protein [Paraperlucidibaca wandonensis]|uniref:Glycosyltransferase family 87 protein n=1 Tax=Paraperlucidibaca wandonensis TaxID=1268273 RepID=A0ABW3HH85_9GAMM
MELLFLPTSAFLTAALVGLAPYSIALTLYRLSGLIAFILAVSAPHYKRSVILLLIIAPMTSFNIIIGQNGLISAALLIGGLRLLSYHPSLAGVLFGLLAFKPIIGLLIPLLLLIRKDWSAFISASLTVVASALLPILLWGPEVWTLFFSQAIEVQQNTLHYATGIGMHLALKIF